MADLKITQDEFGQYDIVLDSNDIVLDYGLEGALYTCLFVDKGDNLHRDRKWFGVQVLNQSIGGELYKYTSGTYYNGVTSGIKSAIENACQVLIDQNVADNIQATVIRDSETNNLDISVAIEKGINVVTTRYALNWNTQLLRRV